MSFLVGLAAVAIMVLFLQGYKLLRTPVSTGVGFQGLELAGPPQRTSLVGKLLDFLDRVVGGRVLGEVGADARAKARNLIQRAGSPDDLTVESLIRRQASWAFLGVVMAVLMFVGGSVMGLALPVLGWFMPRIFLFFKAKERTTEIEAQLPDFLDVLSVTISAGLGFRSALRRVATLVDGPVAEEMMLALRQIDLGSSRRSAFEEMRERSSSPSLNNFITSFLQAEELGTPITGFLESYSKEMRRTAGQRARKAAAQANPKISLILTLVIMPAITLFLLGSIVLMALLDS